MPERISIVIPVFNHKEALERALVSIASQTYADIEVIVVDDGSGEEMSVFFPDRRIRMGREDIRNKKQFRLLRQEHAGAPAARNYGFKESTGEYIIFWDADVTGAPTMLEKMHDALQEHPEASYAYSDFYFGKKLMRAQPYNSTTLQLYNSTHTTTLIRRNALVGISHAPWDESLKRFQDWDLWLTMSEQGKRGIHIPETLFRVASGGTMSRWLPSFAYKKPWRWLPGVRGLVKEYNRRQSIVQRKHGING